MPVVYPSTGCVLVNRYARPLRLEGRRRGGGVKALRANGGVSVSTVGNFEVELSRVTEVALYHFDPENRAGSGCNGVVGCGMCRVSLDRWIAVGGFALKQRIWLALAGSAPLRSTATSRGV
eukprot:3708700-Rhodomonas_salina.5